MKAISVLLSVFVMFFLCMDANATSSRKIVMEEFMIQAADPGIKLYVRNKHPQGAKKFTGDKILLFVHGSTYPCEAAFDLKLSGLSWMEYIAQHGYDVYFVDLRATENPHAHLRWTNRPPTTIQSFVP